MKMRRILVVAGAALIAANVSAQVSAVDGLMDGFLRPPASARPQVWWHWMNGNVSKAGITADLEAMARVGIGGAQIFDASDDIPAGPVAFGSEEWKSLVRFAAQEAKRLGLELAIHNCSGWSSSGGPWVAPSNAQKRVVFTETAVKGGSRFRGVLPAPPDPYGYYRDIAVVAVKTPSADLVRMEDFGVSVSSSGSDGISFRFAKEFPAAGLSFACPVVKPRYADLYVTVTADGERLVDARRVCAKVMGDRNRTAIYVPFARRIAARRIDVTFAYKGGKPRPAIEVPRIESGFRTPDLASKTLAIRYDSYPRENPPVTDDQIVQESDVKVLARGAAAEGTVEWDAPDGEWTLIRFGYACDGAKNRPGSFAGVGLEADKLDARAVDAHYREFCRLVPSPEEGLTTLIVDSYEVGCPNWTESFEEEFRKRRGYDIVPHLVKLTGRIVGGVRETERALADYRRTVADLFVENYGRHFAELCHRDGYLFELEGYGNCPASELEYGRWADVPMGEFWAHPGHDSQTGNTRYAGFVSHVWGRRFAASESFTADPRNGRWQQDAFALKRQGDCVYASGVNRIVYHRYAHQPWTEPTRYPGMTMGPHGTHFERTLTWWDQSAEWLAYQTRCQWMLQEGVFVADALCFCGEDAPHCGWTYPLEHWHEYERATLPVPDGYAFDCCALDALEAAKVEDGQIVVPGGVRYAVLGLPGESGLGVRSRAAIDRLVAAGAKAVPHQELPKALAGMGRSPDFQCDRKDARWIHRRHADGSEAYFVSFANLDETRTACRFRVTGKVPELWNPETGEICRAAEWSEEGDVTKVAFEVRPIGSMFVVFRPQALASAPVRPPLTLRRTEDVKGQWTVSFPAKFAPNPLAQGADETVEFPTLVSWTERPERDIRYFSGSATYAKTIACAVPKEGERLTLDLGEVKNFADVTVDGHRHPTLWKPPFRVDVTDEAKDGRLVVEVKVTNLWVNRLIGDDALPVDCDWDGEGRVGLKEIPAWVGNGEPSPSRRLTFTTWRHWLKDDQPLASGLLGPVKLLSHAESSGPLVVMRLTDSPLRKTDFFRDACRVHARYHGAFDEFWFGGGKPLCTIAAAREELKRFAALRPDIEAAGMKLSFQQGLTLGHGYEYVGVPGSQAAAGVYAAEEAEPFPPDAWLVLPDGTAKKGQCLCPRSPDVLNYERRYAKAVMEELRPFSYWLDDDLRLGVGKGKVGCFCPRCLAAFNAEAKTSFTREALVKRLFEGRETDALRLEWIRFNEQSLAGYARVVREAANSVQPDCRLSIQTVSADCLLNGRDYGPVLEALSDSGRVPAGIRPGHGCYRDENPMAFLGKALWCTREAERCRRLGSFCGTVCYEEETYPRRVLHKSPNAIVTECALALASGCDTISLYWADGEESERIEDYERFVKAVARARPYFERLSSSVRRTSLGGLARYLGSCAFEQKGFSLSDPADVLLARAGIPVTVAEATAACKVWFLTDRSRAAMTADELAKLRAEGCLEIVAEAHPSVSTRTAWLDEIDRLTQGRFPVRIDLPHALRVLPRLRKDGTVDSVTLLNLSMGDTDELKVRVRRSASETPVLMDGKGLASRRLSVGKGELSDESVVVLENLGGWQAATIFF